MIDATEPSARHSENPRSWDGDILDLEMAQSMCAGCCDLLLHCNDVRQCLFDVQILGML
jgi:hypothetical protein